MSQFKPIFIILFALQTTFIYSQKTISKKEKQAAIENVKESIDSNYVFVDKAKRINKALDSIYASGRYNPVNEYKAFATTLTDDLLTISKDKHFEVQYRPDLAESRRKREAENDDQIEEHEETFDINYWYSQKINFGFEKVEILEGNIGYIKLTFFDIFQWVKPTIDATMGFVANTDALIIDLRGNGGGYRSATYMASYFFDEKPLLWSTTYNRATGETENEYIFQEIDGTRYLDKPIYILVDGKSFSRAEGFSYGMKHFKKATIIGQTTPGAAHGINFVELDNSFFIQVPVERNINPITKTDWEGKGVIPHIRTKEEETLKVAYTKALEMLMTSKKDEALGRHYDKLLKKYQGIIEKINNQSAK